MSVDLQNKTKHNAFSNFKYLLIYSLKCIPYKMLALCAKNVNLHLYKLQCSIGTVYYYVYTLLYFFETLIGAKSVAKTYKMGVILLK